MNYHYYSILQPQKKEDKAILKTSQTPKNQDEIYFFTEPLSLQEISLFIECAYPLFGVLLYALKNQRAFVKKYPLPILRSKTDFSKEEFFAKVVACYLGSFSEEQAYFFLSFIKKKIKGLQKWIYIYPLEKELIDNLSLEQYQKIVSLLSQNLQTLFFYKLNPKSLTPFFTPVMENLLLKYKLYKNIGNQFSNPLEKLIWKTILNQ